ncbi:MAG: response regulator transcription factor [Bacteroidales bacterium]|nr:response regulator transcription factor [Bacteroidales bacterium]
MREFRGKILLAEDNKNLRTILKDYLTTIRFNVDDFNNGLTALQNFAQCKYDICILDIVMPGMNGLELLQEIRKKDEEIPVIFLTVRGDKEDKIKAFQLGCDDYITKPFNVEELVLRIEAILRRTRRSKIRKSPMSATPQKFNLGDFVFDTDTHELIHPLQRRVLTKKETELLRIFCENKDKLIPREYILRQVWGTDDYATSRSMDVFLTKLRSYFHIGQTDKDIKPAIEIKNIHGTGFILKVNQP